MDFRAICMGLAFAFMWSSAFTSARMIVADAPPLTALAARFLVSGLIGVGMALAPGPELSAEPRSNGAPRVIFGISQNALYLGLNFVAMQWVQASLAAIIASAMPLLVALLGWLFLGDQRLRPLGVCRAAGRRCGRRADHGSAAFGRGQTRSAWRCVCRRAGAGSGHAVGARRLVGRQCDDDRRAADVRRGRDVLAVAGAAV